MLDQLPQEDRLRLLRFTCSFAWADLEIRQAEADFVRRLVEGLKLSEEDLAKAEAWLQSPPRPDEVDPQDIKNEHSRYFLDVAADVIETDGEIAPAERELLDIFTELLGH